MSGFRILDGGSVWERFDRAVAQAAKEIATLGTLLVCTECRRTVAPTPQQLSGYLRHGWPTCHGLTMELRDPPPEDTKK